MTFFGFSENNYEDFYSKTPAVSKEETSKFKASLGVVSEAERDFLETLRTEHRDVFYFNFVKSVNGFHATVHSDDNVWAPWLKFMLVERSRKILKLKEKSLMFQSSAVPEKPLEETCEGIYYTRKEIPNLSDTTGHIRFKVYVDPNDFS